MSIQINCDRCGKDTRLYFVEADLVVKRGHTENIDSKVHPNIGLCRFLHLCEACFKSLKEWLLPPEQEDQS